MDRLYTLSHRFIILFLVIIAAPTYAQIANEDIKLLANDAASNDWFGISVAINNGIIAVGSHRDDVYGEDSGSVYLFDAATGTQTNKLLPSDGEIGDLFGHSLAIDNGIVAIGAPFDDDNGTDSGSVYLFDANTGIQIMKLLPTDGEEGEKFGKSIAIDNGIVAIGAWFDDDRGFSSGSAYLFDTVTGVQIAKLLPSGSSVADYFGWSIAINNGLVAVGSIGDNGGWGIKSGSVYLFDASTGTQIDKLSPNDGASYDEFGYSVAMSDDTIAIGAVFDDDNGAASGSVYLFDLPSRVQKNKLTPSNGMFEDRFGFSISIDDNIIVVGSIGDTENGFLAGSSYLFNASTGSQIAKLLPSDGERYDYFGWSTAIENGIVTVGAGSDDPGGSAYIFDFNCPADLCFDLTLDFFDVSEFLTLFAAQDPTADFYTDGFFDFFDVSAFLTAFAAGCP